MSNHPSQEQSTWSARSSRDDGYGRMSRDPYRDQEREQEYGGQQRRHWQQEGRSRNYEPAGFSPSDREFYEQNQASQNYGAYRGGRQNEQWPRNEDRENYSAAPEYGRPDSYFGDHAQNSGNRFYSAGRQHGGGYGEPGQSYGGQNYGRGYGGGQSYGGANAPYAQPSRWRERNQQQAWRGGSDIDDSDFSTHTQYGYGGERNFNQPGFFQAGDFSQQGGYTRSEYPEDSYLHGGYSPSRFNQQNQQAGRTLGTQNWQERAGANRGAFGLQASHRGRGPQGYTRSDERIREDICERLSEHHYIDASQIRVEVSQGVVTLEGSVDDRWQKYQTEDLADATSGVKDIQNRLNVSRASQQSSQWTSQQATPQTAAQTSATSTATTGKKGSEQGERGH